MKNTKWPKVFAWKSKQAFWYFKDANDQGVWYHKTQKKQRADYTPEEIIKDHLGIPSTEEELALFLLENDIKYN